VSAERDKALFACGGRLADEVFVSRLLQHPVAGEPAVLSGYELVAVAGQQMATPTADGCGALDGVAYVAISAADYRRLDAYMGVSEGLSERRAGSATLPTGSRLDVAVYVPTDKARRQTALTAEREARRR
jgi:hypothetical protein